MREWEENRDINFSKNYFSICKCTRRRLGKLSKYSFINLINFIAKFVDLGRCIVNVT